MRPGKVVGWFACLAIALAGNVLNAAQTAPEGWTALRGTAAQDSRVLHEGKPSLRVEADGSTDATVQSAPVTLTIGKRYELSAWVRTQNLQVRDTARTPVAIGAALTMESMPFDVHSESVGGTHDWTRLRLRFTATRVSDRVILSAGLGGAAAGRAWFEGVSLDNAAASGWPRPEAVEAYGPAYRFPQAGGWTYLHIEGEPYERGYQHGRLMASEISDYIDRCARLINANAKESAWDQARTTANALFLRGFDREILEEMRGIADGTKAAGAKWNNRDIDLVDIVTANTFVELGTLDNALPLTPTGLEGLKMEPPKYGEKLGREHCSAFAATGSATRDGKMVIAHITMWPLLLAEASNVMLDIKPATGHRMLIQSYAGGIESGLDWYQNDAGIVLAETTIRQSPFNARGTPVAYRARKAIQYGDTVDKIIEYLSRDNNGLYTNEWLIGDGKNNEIAMCELGTNKIKTWRSSRNEWFGGAKGFYWGCNNAKDLSVRLEYQPDPNGPPAHVPFVPQPRDIKWQELYREYKGRIDEQFGFLAFRTAPLVSSTSMDGKVTTADMANRMMVWASFGKPNQREWVPDGHQRSINAAGIYSGGYQLIAALPEAPASAQNHAHQQAAPAVKQGSFKDRLWHGWILPASDADVWLSAGSAAYYRDLNSDNWEEGLAADRAEYSSARITGEMPLSKLAATAGSPQWYRLAEHKGALLFDTLRREIGDDAFFRLMRDFFGRNTTKPVSTAQFIAAAEKESGRPLASFFRAWLEETGPAAGVPIYLTGDIRGRLSSALIVYGTTAEAGTNRYAAEQVRNHFLDWFEDQTPLRKDFELSEDDVRTHDIVFVGRPELNSALAALQERVGLRYDGAQFVIKGAVHAAQTEAVALAVANPLDPRRMILVVAGNSPLETVRVARGDPFAGTQYVIFRNGRQSEAGFLQ